MIETLISPSMEPRYEFRLRPDRAITAFGLGGFFLALACFSIAVASFSAWQGNVFAPLFAVLELAVVGVVLRWVWRAQSERVERIALSREALTVARQPLGDELRFHPFWVRVQRAPAGDRSGRRSVLLTSHGRTVEVGAFLGDAERGQLESLLAAALGALRHGPESVTQGKASE